MKLTATLVACALLCSALGAFALTEEQTAGMDALLAKTLTSLTTAEPAVWTLFSSQGSAAVIGTPEGPVAASRSKIKTNPDLAAKFTLPAGLTEVKEERKLKTGGEFIMGRFRLEREVDGAKEKWDLTVVAVRDGENRSWRYITLAAMPTPKEADAVNQQAVSEVLKAWEGALLDANTAGLAEVLNADPLCLGVYTPDGQPWFFTDRDYIVSTLDSLTAMGTASASSLSELDTRANATVATAVGKWHVELPLFEPLDAAFTALFIKPADKWMLVSMCAGPAEK